MTANGRGWGRAHVLKISEKKIKRHGGQTTQTKVPVHNMLRRTNSVTPYTATIYFHYIGLSTLTIFVSVDYRF